MMKTWEKTESRKQKAERQAAPVDMPLRGTVKWFAKEKGYGFIERSDGQGDVFVHYSDVEGEGRRDLEEGQFVEFRLGEGKKGPKAVEVQLLS